MKPNFYDEFTVRVQNMVGLCESNSLKLSALANRLETDETPQFLLTDDDGVILDPPQIFRTASHDVPTLRRLAALILSFPDQVHRLVAAAESSDFVVAESLASELLSDMLEAVRIKSDWLSSNIYHYPDVGLTELDLGLRPLSCAEQIWFLCRVGLGDTEVNYRGHQLPAEWVWMHSPNERTPEFGDEAVTVDLDRPFLPVVPDFFGKPVVADDRGYEFVVGDGDVARREAIILVKGKNDE